MSEKRFEVENERTVYDTLLHRGFVCSWKTDAEELVGLLNSLSEENEQLRQEIKRLEKMIWKIQWRFQQEMGIEKAKEHYQEIDKEMKE